MPHVCHIVQRYAAMRNRGRCSVFGGMSHGCVLWTWNWRGSANPPNERKRRAQVFARGRDTPAPETRGPVPRRQECGVWLLAGSIKRARRVPHVPFVSVEGVEKVYLWHCRPRKGKRNAGMPDASLSPGCLSSASPVRHSYLSHRRRKDRPADRSISWPPSCRSSSTRSPSPSRS